MHLDILIVSSGLFAAGVLAPMLIRRHPSLPAGTIHLIPDRGDSHG